MSINDAEDFQPIFTVVLVEDDQEVNQRLSDLISEHPKFKLLASELYLSTALESLQQLKPDVLLTDIGLPDGSGIDLIKAIHDHHLDTEAMVISGFQDEHLVFKALEAGAKGYVLKHDKRQKICDALLTMIYGGAPISPVIARLMLSRFESPSVSPELPEVLTERQSKILKLVCQGFSSREIAEKLGITYYTVTTHIKNIYQKLQVNSRAEAINEAIKLGLYHQ
ncbi:MAG: response regulator transcription factor [Pseudomonadales bacterium]|nr:response regulator transcription factor [Pseudomonadales bacterium]